MNKRKGITVIPLVITIIVLLIFSGVSIATLTGENGILKEGAIGQRNNRPKTRGRKCNTEAI